MKNIKLSFLLCGLLLPFSMESAASTPTNKLLELTSKALVFGSKTWHRTILPELTTKNIVGGTAIVGIGLIALHQSYKASKLQKDSQEKDKTIATKEAEIAEVRTALATQEQNFKDRIQQANKTYEAQLNSVQQTTEARIIAQQQELVAAQQSATQAQADIAAKEQELQAARQEQTQLQQRLQDLQGQLTTDQAALRAQLAAAQESVAAKEQELIQARQAQEQLRQNLVTKEQEHKEETQHIKQRHRVLKELKAYHKQALETRNVQLLEKLSRTESSQKATALKNIRLALALNQLKKDFLQAGHDSQSLVEQVDAAQKEHAELAGMAQEEIETRANTQAQTRLELDETKQALQSAQANQAELNNIIQEKIIDIRRLEATSTELSRQLNQLNQIIAQAQPQETDENKEQDDRSQSAVARGRKAFERTDKKDKKRLDPAQLAHGIAAQLQKNSKELAEARTQLALLQESSQTSTHALTHLQQTQVNPFYNERHKPVVKPTLKEQDAFYQKQRINITPVTDIDKEYTNIPSITIQYDTTIGRIPCNCVSSHYVAEPASKDDSRKKILMLSVHGTIVQFQGLPKPSTEFGADETDPCSRAFRHQAQEIARLQDAHVDFMTMRWTGQLDHTARVNAGSAIAHIVKKYKAENPDALIYMVAHSHGGNCIKEALIKLKNESDIAIDHVVLFATPDLERYRAHQHTFNANITAIWGDYDLTGNAGATFDTPNTDGRPKLSIAQSTNQKYFNRNYRLKLNGNYLNHINIKYMIRYLGTLLCDTAEKYPLNYWFVSNIHHENDTIQLHTGIEHDLDEGYKLAFRQPQFLTLLSSEIQKTFAQTTQHNSQNYSNFQQLWTNTYNPRLSRLTRSDKETLLSGKTTRNTDELASQRWAQEIIFGTDALLTEPAHGPAAGGPSNQPSPRQTIP